jgi:hypothetical protein
MRGAKKSKKARPSEAAIDEAVALEAGDNRAWDPPVRVNKPKAGSVTISSELAGGAAFLANLHRESWLDGWVERVPRERVKLEQRAFSMARKELAS